MTLHKSLGQHAAHREAWPVVEGAAGSDRGGGLHSWHPAAPITTTCYILRPARSKQRSMACCIKDRSTQNHGTQDSNNTVF